MTDNPAPNDIALLREAAIRAALCLSGFIGEGVFVEGFEDPADAWCRVARAVGLPVGDDDDLRALLAPGQHDGAAGEGDRELEYFNRTTCACTAACAYVAACDKHGAKPSAKQARAEGAQTYAVDDCGLFCRHCGRASWLHHRVIGAGNFCVAPDATPSSDDALGEGL